MPDVTRTSLWPSSLDTNSTSLPAARYNDADVSNTNFGNIGVHPVVGGLGGPALSQAKIGGGAVSINSSMSVKLPVSGTFDLWALAYANATGTVAGSGNVHFQPR